MKLDILYMPKNFVSLKKKRYIYIYTYIVIHRLTVSLNHNSSVWLDMEDVWSWDRNQHDFLLELASFRSANKRTM